MLIDTREGVTICYVVKRMTDEERWSAEEVRELKGTPQRPNPQKVGLHIPTRMPIGEPPSGVADGDAAGGTKRGYRQSQYRYQIHCLEEHR